MDCLKVMYILVLVLAVSILHLPLADAILLHIAARELLINEQLSWPTLLYMLLNVLEIAALAFLLGTLSGVVLSTWI